MSVCFVCLRILFASTAPVNEENAATKTKVKEQIVEEKGTVESSKHELT